MTESGEQTTGYCQACGQYGQGRFVEVINSHSDAIDRCQGCRKFAVGPPVPRRLPPIDSPGLSGQQRASRT